MEHLGTDFNITGSVMSRAELEELRKKRGECITCGRKCFRKKLFKMVPIDDPSENVLNGRCLICNPIDTPNGNNLPQIRKATQADLARFERSQSNLAGSSRSLLSGGSSTAPPRRGNARAYSTIGGLDGSARSRPGLSSRSQSYMPSSSAAIPEQSARRAPLAPPVESQSLPLPPPPTSRSLPPLGSNGSSHSQDRDRNLGGSARYRASSRPVMTSSLNSYEEEPPHNIQRANYARAPSIHEDEGDFHENIDYSESIRFAHRVGSERSLHSGSSLGDRSAEMDNFDVGPAHGVLDRGGAYGGGNRPVGTHIFGGSTRTLSSMSSMEDDHLPPAMVSMQSVYEEASESVMSRSSKGRTTNSLGSADGAVSRGSGSRGGMDLGAEQEYMAALRQGHDNYSDVVLVLREAFLSPNVVRQGLEDLARFKLAEEDLENLADMGAPQVIADCFLQHRDNFDVQLWGIAATWNMSAITRNQLIFASNGVLDRIVTAMANFMDHDDLQEKAIATISNLGATPENLSVLLNCGAVKRIVEAMNRYSEVPSVQIKGCSAATNLASHNSPLKLELMQQGIGGAIVVAMVMHPEDFFLQEKALRALRNLCANCDQNKLELANIGGVDAVISAMQVHRDEVGVQQEGAWTLSNLAGNDSNKAVIGDTGGIDVVIRAMWVHSDNVGVQEWCCRALYTLTLDPHNGGVVLEIGGISAIVNAMQAHVDSTAVQEMGCAVLSNLADTKESKMRIVDEEALDAIVLAMVLHADDMQIQERACMVLLRLAISENYKPMQAANIGELVKTAGQKFPEQCEEAAARLIRAFESY